MSKSILNFSSNIITLFIVVTIGICAAFDIKEHFKLCNRDSAEVDDCLKTAIQEAMTGAVLKGIPDIDFPVLDPFLEESVHIEYKSNQIFTKMSMKNILTTGLSKSKVKNVRSKIDEDQFHLEVDMATPAILVTGEYDGHGGYNTIKVNSKGEFNCTMKKLKYTWKLDGIPEERDGKTYIKIHSLYMRPDIQHFDAYASNIFPNNPQLTEQANKIVIQNWRFLYQELLPITQANWNKTGSKVANKLFSKIPYEELFPLTS